MKTPSALPPRLLAALLIALAVLAYFPVFSAGYIWDDASLLTENPQVRSLQGLTEIWNGSNSRDYTPLTLTVFWLEWHLWGCTPGPYHAVNVLLHALAGVLLWRLLLRLRVPGAWLGALLFTIHPVNAASVAWIAELKNTLSAVLCFGSMLCFLESRERNRRFWYAWCAVLFALAALSKGSAAMMPAGLLLCLLWRDGTALPRRALYDLARLLFITAALAWFTIAYQSRAPHYGLHAESAAYRLARAGADIWYYLGGIFWPAGMCPIRPPWTGDPRSAGAWLPVAGAVGLLGLFFSKRRKWGRPLLFAYGWFLLMLLPVLGFVWMALMQETPVADWWQYLAAPGIFAVAGAALTLLVRRVRVAAAGIAALVIVLMMQTWLRAELYHSMASYCAAVTAEDPHAWTLQNNLGILLKRQERFAEAEACYRQALADNPRYMEARINLANALAATGDARGAQAELDKARAISPDNPALESVLAGPRVSSTPSPGQ